MWPFSSRNAEELGNPGWQGRDISDDQLTKIREERQKQIQAQRRKELEEGRKQSDEEVQTRAKSPHYYTAETDPSLKDLVVQQHERLGMHPVVRFMLLGGISFFGGFGLGAAQGSRAARLRYTAENAHHTPLSQAGWYLYNKSKNYHGILGGAKEGVKFGLRQSGWAAMFVVLEEGLDRARARAFRPQDGEDRKGQRDFLNTLSAAVALASIHGWWNRLDRFAAMRMTRFAVRYALPYGLTQDLLASMRGDRPWYVDSFMKRTMERNKQEVVAVV